LLKVLGRHFFTVTTYLLVLLAAGMTSQAIGFLSMGGIVPEIIYPVWDSSFLISEQGILGKVLHALIGYISRPSAAQLIGYFAVVILLIAGLHYDWIKEKFSKKTFLKKLSSRFGF
jgi:high-affinity iron transporter